MTTENVGSKLKLIFADDIMTTEVVVIKESMLIGQVAHLMLKERVSSYPIVDEQGNLAGIVTLTDLFNLIDKLIRESKAYLKKYEWQAVEAAVKSAKGKPISEIMSKNVVTVKPETPLLEILEHVSTNKIHTFPVVRDGKLIGIVGRHDVLNATFVYG